MNSITQMNSVKFNKYIGISFGKINNHLKPSSINMHFLAQQEFESGAIFRIGDGGLVFSPKDKELIKYRREIFDYCFEDDHSLVIERNLSFDVCRIILPSFNIRYIDSTEVEVESFITFFENGLFSINYIYNFHENMSAQSISKVKIWNDAEYILIDKLFYGKLRLKAENVNDEILNSDDLEYIGIQISDLKTWDLSLNRMMMEFVESFIKEEFTYYLYSESYECYYLSYMDNSHDNSPVFSHWDVFRLIESRSASYVFNEKSVHVPVNLSFSVVEKLWIHRNYCVSFGLENDRRTDISKKIEHNNIRNFTLILILLEHYLIDKYNIIDKIRYLRKLDLFNLSSGALLEIHSSLLDLHFDRTTFDFQLNRGSKLSLNVINIFEIDKLYKELENQIKKIEKIIELRNLNYKEEENRQKEKRDLLIQVFAIILAIPAITQIVDLFKQLIDPQIDGIATTVIKINLIIGMLLLFIILVKLQGQKKLIKFLSLFIVLVLVNIFLIFINEDLREGVLNTFQTLERVSKNYLN